jgi:hypothetical protein
MTRVAVTRASLDRLLLGAAAALALAGVTALFWPARDDVAARPLALAPLPAVSADTAATADASHVAAIVQANVFSDSRRPPAVRYDPTGTAMEGEVAPVASAPVASAPVASAPADSEAAPPPFAPTLYGIVADPQGAVALLRLDPHIPGARAYHAGDRGGAYRVVSVGDTAVVLDGPAGRRTLRLAGSPRPSP